MILNLIVLLNVVVIFLFFLQLNRKNKNKASGREMKKQDWGILTLSVGIVLQNGDTLFENVFLNATNFKGNFYLVAWICFILSLIMILASKRN